MSRLRFLLILSLSLAFFLCVINVCNNRNIRSLKIENSNLKSNRKLLLQHFISSIGLFSNQVNDIIFTDSKGNNYSWLELNLKTPLLILKISSSNCSSCLKIELDHFHDLKNRIGMNNLVIISNFGDKYEFLMFIKENSLENATVLNCNSKKLSEFDSINKPYFFILEKSGIMKYIFLPDPFLIDLTNQYFEITKEYIERTK